MDENFESIWQTYNSVMDWVKFSDTKAAVVLATNGVILSIIFTNISEFSSILSGNTPQIILFKFLIIGILLSVASIISSIFCLTPRTDSVSDGINSLYFKDIAKFNSSQDYSKSAESLFSDDSELKKHLFVQIYANSNIATIKYENVKHSIIFLGFAIFFIILPILIIISKMINM
jgi:hypothetical protein